MRFIAATLSASATLPRATWRAMLRSTLSRARSRAPASTSESRTSKPEIAQTWAMPLPIWPAPMMPMVWIMGVPGGRDAVREAPLLDLLAELVLDLGQDLEEIADDAVVGDLEDRRFLVLVDG